jgi:hypothetical protein
VIESSRRCRNVIGRRRISKYGIKLPYSVEEALAINERTGTNFWRKAIEKEMKNVRIALKISDDGVIP